VAGAAVETNCVLSQQQHSGATVAGAAVETDCVMSQRQHWSRSGRCCGGKRTSIRGEHGVKYAAL